MPTTRLNFWMTSRRSWVSPPALSTGPSVPGRILEGVYDRNTRKVMTFADTLKGTKEGTEKEISIDDDALVDEDRQAFRDQLVEEIELLDGASAEFDMDLVSKENSPRYSSDLP